jgi:bifunctional non-homologous end joining protein LigD
MLATLAEAPLSDRTLVYEPKYDGIRAIVTVTPRARGQDAEVVIWSRLGNDKTEQFPEIAAALARWGARRNQVAVLDGEIVALDETGEPAGFQRLQERMHLADARSVARKAARTPTALIVFDLLRDGGEELCPLPLVERRRRLEAALGSTADHVIRLARQVAGDGVALMKEARAQGWEGLLVKEARSPYRPGRRSLEWRKLKLLKREALVVGGYTEPRGSRSGFGALLLGLPTAGGRLRYAGHVGGGFSDKELVRVMRLLRARETGERPFETLPPSNERPHWVRPELVAEVQFSAWTADGVLRHPVYVGLREDVSFRDVRREVEVVSPKKAARPMRAPTPEGGSVAGVLDALDALAARGGGRLALPDGTAVDLGNLGKPLWPKLGLSKRDLFRYYIQVSPFLLPVVEDRPLVMKRLPDGVDGPAFYQHRAPEKPPKGVRVQSFEGDDVPSRFVGGSLATLLHMTQLAAISQDPWFSRAQSPHEMDFAAIDLDPMDEAPFSRVRDVARWVHDELDRLGVTGYPKTSGASGLHIYLPMRPGTPYEAGMLFCRIVAELVAAKHPEAATVERVVRRRDPKTVYVDYLQNIEGKTLACAYSARASDYAGASTPLEWDEVDDRLDPRAFTIRTLPERLRAVGDLWAGLRTAPGIDLEAVIERAESRGRKPKPKSKPA